MEGIVLIFFMALVTKSSAVDITAFKTIQINGKCLYASTYKLWPYQEDNMSLNLAKSACQEMGLELAKLESNDENIGLQRMLRCHMTNDIKADESILIDYNLNYNPDGVSFGSNCYFQQPDGSHVAETGKNCQEWFLDSNGQQTKQVNFVCKKSAPCNEIIGCEYRGGDTGRCYYNLGLTTLANAILQCKARNGHLPWITSQAERDALIDTAWLGLFSKTSPLTNCFGVADCITKQNNFFWDGNGVKPDLAVSVAHEPFMGGMQLDEQMPCMRLRSGMARDWQCSGSVMPAFCALPLDGKGLSASVTKPHYLPESLVCGAPNAPPTDSKMLLNSSQPDLMCPGSKARYVCNAGGVNVREDLPTKSTFEVTCGANLQYSYPNPWPACTDRLNCPTPKLDDEIMEYDWTPTKGLIPEYTVQYSCLMPSKKVISRRDLYSNGASDMHDSLSVHCQLNGTYDVDIEKYACTRPCEHPTLPEPAIMTHDWDINSTKPEILQEIRYRCLNGRHLVLKEHFETGEPTPLLDELLASCQVSGWLNVSIESYTCTKACKAPVNNSEVFTFDWNPSSGSEIGTVVSYTCLNPSKMVVNMVENISPLVQTLVTTCLYNGQFDRKITDYGCTECVRRQNPPNGKIVCESRKYEEGKSCILQCDNGYIPLGKTYMTCMFDEKLQDFIWSIEEHLFQCVEPIALVVGGQSKDLRYLDNVEIVAPGYACDEEQITPYPLKVYGAAAGFVDGQTIVCGGGFEGYVDCSIHEERSTFCEKNIECIKTKGGTLWCTGPRTNLCYSYDALVTKAWTVVAKLKTPRALAASTVSFDGTFWLLGGISPTEILASTEKLNVVGSNGKWASKIGVSLPVPLIGACASPLSINELVVIGGFANTNQDYSEDAYILNIVTNTWYKKPWAKLNGGPGFDISCSHVNWNAKKYVLLAGGWNNTANMNSELLDPETLKFMPIMEVDQVRNMTNKPLPFQMRSATMTELNMKPTLIGGVICKGNYKQKQVCERTNKVFQLTETEGSTSADGTDANWIEQKSSSMKTARSGHATLTVPKDFAPKCIKD